jgi:hypothetical protein
MKINLLETHDRYQYLTRQSFDIAQCCQDLINQRPFGNHPFYIFAHARTHEDNANKRLIWQPRLTKPKAQTNSMLFKAYPGTDLLKVIWMIPARELWNQYKKGNIVENETVSESIYAFINHRKKLEEKENDDLDDAIIDAIYAEISRNLARERSMDNLWIKQSTEAQPSISSELKL